MRKKIKKEELKVGDYAYVVDGSIDYFRNNGYYCKVVEISEVFDERKQKTIIGVKVDIGGHFYIFDYDADFEIGEYIGGTYHNNMRSIDKYVRIQEKKNY